MPHADVNGTRLYFEQYGEGPPVLLLPGVGGDTRSMMLQAAALAQAFQVVSVDLRGAGRSDIPEGPYETGGMAVDAVAVLDHLQIDQVHVVGYSLGSAVAQEFVLAYPDRVNKLVLISPWASLRPVVRRFMGFLEDVLLREVEVPDVWLATFPWFASPTFMANDAMVEAAVDLLSRSRNPARGKGRAAQLRASIDHDSTGRLREIRRPTFIVAGNDDVISPPGDVTNIADQIPESRLEITPRGGHGLIYEYPDELNAAIIAFLSAP